MSWWWSRWEVYSRRLASSLPCWDCTWDLNIFKSSQLIWHFPIMFFFHVPPIPNSDHSDINERCIDPAVYPALWYCTRGCRLLFLIPEPVLYCPTSTSHSDQLGVRGFFLSFTCASRVTWVNIEFLSHALVSLWRVTFSRLFFDIPRCWLARVTSPGSDVRVGLLCFKCFGESHGLLELLTCHTWRFIISLKIYLFASRFSVDHVSRCSCQNIRYHHFCMRFVMLWAGTTHLAIPWYSSHVPSCGGFYHRRYPQSKGNITWLEEEYAISSILDSILLSIFGFFRARLW